MARLLNDEDLKKLLGTVILNGLEDCIRGNSYRLRLGNEFRYTGETELLRFSDNKRAFLLPQFMSVGICSLETVDFRRETVDKLFPGKNLHAIMTPTSDLHREGIVAPTTQVDAGWFGLLTWQLANLAPNPNTFKHKEEIYRITIFLLDENEIPKKLYDGAHNCADGLGQTKRPGLPRDIVDENIVKPRNGISPEEHLSNLMRFGYPWSILGEKLEGLGAQYSNIASMAEGIDKYNNTLAEQIRRLIDKLSAMDKKISDVENEVKRMNITIIAKLGAGATIIGGLIIAVCSSDKLSKFVNEYGGIIGLASIVAALIIYYLFGRSDGRREGKPQNGR